MRKLSLLLTLAVAAPAFAGPVKLQGGAKSEEKLRRFVERDAKLAARLKDAVRREERFVAEARESDLRDAVADTSVNDIRMNAEKTTGEKRKAILESMPGMKAIDGPACATLASCPEPEMAIEVSDAANLSDSLRRMVRPWMALYARVGIDSFNTLNDSLPYYVGAGVAFDDSDIKLLFALR